jgi:hypothetical protein
MSVRFGRLLRGARSAVFAAVCVGLSAAGHVWMSGHGLPFWALVLAFTAVGAAGYALAGRQRGLVSISALMLAAEGGLHLLFTATQAPQSSDSSSAAQRLLGATFATLPASARRIPLSDWVCGTMGGAGMGGSGGLSARLAADLMAAGHGLGMAAAHAVAGLACAWWLWRGESAVFRLLRWLGTLAAPLLAVLWPGSHPAPDFASGRIAHVGENALGHTLRLLSARVVRRGPPRLRFCM